MCAAREKAGEKARAELASKRREFDALTSGRTKSAYESKLAQSQKALDDEKAKQAESRRQFAVQLKPLDDAHTFRRALLSDPTAVEFVRGDAEWLRLVLLMYGGLADTRVAAQ